jgi:hypothetical protein
MESEMKTEYRGYARQALEHAKQELPANDDVRLRSAALQLRMAIEALTYDRAQVYATEIPPEEYAIWQPKQVMRLLLEIDANADASSTLRVGTEEVYGVPAKEMMSLGSEKVFDLAAIKKNYDALGSYLHMPTSKQMQESEPFNTEKFKARCLRIVAELEKALASPVWNIAFGVFSKIDCIYCEKPIRKRCPRNGSLGIVKCFECGAQYRLIPVNDDKIHWEPLQKEVSCPTNGCEHKFFLGEHEIKRGVCWTCPSCDHHYKIDYAIVPNVSPG